MQFWNNFAAKHPAAAKWVREGGLFVVVSNLITVFKYLLLQFLPKAFASLPCFPKCAMWRVYLKPRASAPATYI